MSDLPTHDRLGRRILRGEEHGRTRLTAVQAREIRERYAAGGISMSKLGIAYGVSEQPIIDVLHFVTHVNAGGPQMPKKRAPNAKIPLAEHAAIRKRRADGDALFAIAADYGVHPATIKKIAPKH